jgi:hypothetical protein
MNIHTTMAPQAHPAASMPRSYPDKTFSSLIDHYREAREDFYLADDDTESDRLLNIVSAVEEAIIARPAPDFEGVLAKLEIGTTAGRDLPSEWAEVIRDDLMLLANISQSPTFLPLAWLTDFETSGGKATLSGSGDAVDPVFNCPADNERTRQMIGDLKHHEAMAIAQHLRGMHDTKGLTREVAQHG